MRNASRAVIYAATAFDDEGLSCRTPDDVWKNSPGWETHDLNLDACTSDNQRGCPGFQSTWPATKSGPKLPAGVSVGPVPVIQPIGLKAATVISNKSACGKQLEILRAQGPEDGSNSGQAEMPLWRILLSQLMGLAMTSGCFNSSCLAVNNIPDGIDYQPCQCNWMGADPGTQQVLRSAREACYVATGGGKLCPVDQKMTTNTFKPFPWQTPDPSHTFLVEDAIYVCAPPACDAQSMASYLNYVNSYVEDTNGMSLWRSGLILQKSVLSSVAGTVTNSITKACLEPLAPVLPPTQASDTIHKIVLAVTLLTASLVGLALSAWCRVKFIDATKERSLKERMLAALRGRYAAMPEYDDEQKPEFDELTGEPLNEAARKMLEAGSSDDDGMVSEDEAAEFDELTGQPLNRQAASISQSDARHEQKKLRKKKKKDRQSGGERVPIEYDELTGQPLYAADDRPSSDSDDNGDGSSSASMYQNEFGVSRADAVADVGGSNRGVQMRDLSFGDDGMHTQTGYQPPSFSSKSAKR
eukprot:g1165.t1